MHIHPLAFVIVGGVLGVGLIAYARRGERRLRTLLFALPVIGAIWLAVDFVITPEDRWVNGITLALRPRWWPLAHSATSGFRRGASRDSGATNSASVPHSGSRRTSNARGVDGPRKIRGSVTPPPTTTGRTPQEQAAPDGFPGERTGVMWGRAHH